LWPPAVVGLERITLDHGTGSVITSPVPSSSTVGQLPRSSLLITGHGSHLLPRPGDDTAERHVHISFEIHEKLERLTRR
jgi:hypothetical protein